MITWRTWLACRASRSEIGILSGILGLAGAIGVGAVGVGVISIGSCDGWQAGATAANESCPLGRLGG